MAPAEHPARSSFDRSDAFVLGVVCIAALAHTLWFNHTADDAYISFRYVDNWVRGNGLVFNPGERVMGYSNFLWVVVLYPFALIGIPVPTAARVLGVLLAWSTLAHLYAYARRTFAGRLPAIAAASVLAANGSFALWMLGGLESQLLALLITVGITGALEMPDAAPSSRYVWLGIVFGLAGITHPEPIIYVVPAAAWLWLRTPTREHLWYVALFAGVAASFVAVFALSAWLYYGDPLPNTYYAKTQPVSGALLERGLRMARKLIVDYRWTPIGIILLWLVAVRGSLRARGWLPLAVIATFVTFFLGIGGDMLQYHRMWVPVLPLLSLLFAEAVSRINRPAVGLALTAATIGLTLPNSFHGRNLESLRKGDEFLDGAHRVAERLAELPESTWVAANNIGVLGFESRVRILDMMGLTDRHIARAPGKKVGIPGHEAHDGAYVLDRRPEIIITGMPRAVATPNPVWDTGRGGYPSDVDLGRDPRFAEHYALRYLELSDGRWAPMFVRNDIQLERTWSPDG